MGPQQLQYARMAKARATPTNDNADMSSVGGSPGRGSLFRTHRETVEQMLIRKLR